MGDTTATQVERTIVAVVLAATVGPAVHELVRALRRTSTELGEAEELFRNAFDDSQVGMALVSLGGRFLRVNRALREITGYPEHELLGRTFGEITHPDDVDTDLDALRDLIDGERYGYRTEKRYVHADGTYGLDLPERLARLRRRRHAQLPDQPDRGHLRPQGVRGAPHPPGAARLAHRAAQPDPVRRSRPHVRQPPQHDGLRDRLSRPRRLQARQRHARPRRRGPGPDRGRPPARAADAGRRHAGTPGRRRVRAALRGGGRARGASDRRPGDRRDGQADRCAGQDDHPGRQHRDLPLLGRGPARGARRDARGGGPRHVPGQGGGEVTLRAVRDLDADGRDRPDRARAGSPGGDRQRTS